jgi:hypothetical protein
MRVLAFSMLVLLAACGESRAPQAAPGDSGPATSSPAAVAASAASSGAYPTLDGRSGELVNPDESTMVLLYFDLAGIKAPLDQWVEDDQRVRYAPGPRKAGLRTQVRAELDATVASVRNVGVIRLSLSTQLSDYDPTYGEYTISGLAPSSVVTFKAFQQEVTLRFGNGRTAQVWAVPKEQAQTIDDALGYDRSVTVDAVLHVSAVQPAPRGGTIVADVVEYELRQTRSDRLLARVKVPRP